jgi:MoxR-like ATPase
VKIDRYRGDGLPPDRDPARRFPYLADERLARVVNMAIVLRRPLLVKGPPGCGKTRLAAAVAHELGLPFHEWYVKSTSRARDGLYTIDVLRRLQDAQMNRPEAQRITPYLRFGPLGEALRSPAESVILIDEIDKADIDFPNDLLHELDRKEFTVEELDERLLTEEEKALGYRRTYRGGPAPVMVITSNDEKELPDAFLRRCLFHYIEFPPPDRLREIVRVNTTDLDVEGALIERAVERLRELRGLGGFRKAPATSELIDWVRILHHWGIGAEALRAEVAAHDLPYWEVLFKHQQDVQSVAPRATEAAP